MGVATRMFVAPGSLGELKYGRPAPITGFRVHMLGTDTQSMPARELLSKYAEFTGRDKFSLTELQTLRLVHDEIDVAGLLFDVVKVPEDDEFHRAWMGLLHASQQTAHRLGQSDHPQWVDPLPAPFERDGLDEKTGLELYHAVLKWQVQHIEVDDIPALAKFNLQLARAMFDLKLEDVASPSLRAFAARRFCDFECVDDPEESSDP